LEYYESQAGAILLVHFLAMTAGWRQVLVVFLLRHLLSSCFSVVGSPVVCSLPFMDLTFRVIRRVHSLGFSSSPNSQKDLNFSVGFALSVS
jgi:hypothetical protein